MFVVVVVMVMVMEDEGLFKLFVKPPEVGGDALPVPPPPDGVVRAKKSCLACSADEIGLLGVGEGLYDNEGVVVDVGDVAVAVVTVGFCCVATGILLGDGAGLYERVGRSWGGGCVLLGGGADLRVGPVCNVTTMSGGPPPGVWRFGDAGSGVVLCVGVISGEAAGADVELGPVPGM